MSERYCAREACQHKRTLHQPDCVMCGCPEWQQARTDGFSWENKPVIKPNSILERLGFDADMPLTPTPNESDDDLCVCGHKFAKHSPYTSGCYVCRCNRYIKATQPDPLLDSPMVEATRLKFYNDVCTCSHSRGNHSNSEGECWVCPNKACRTFETYVLTRTGRTSAVEFEAAAFNQPTLRSSDRNVNRRIVNMKGIHVHGKDCAWDCDEAIMIKVRMCLKELAKRPNLMQNNPEMKQAITVLQKFMPPDEDDKPNYRKVTLED